MAEAQARTLVVLADPVEEVKVQQVQQQVAQLHQDKEIMVVQVALLRITLTIAQAVAEVEQERLARL
jgi:hypothetical protein